MWQLKLVKWYKMENTFRFQTVIHCIRTILSKFVRRNHELYVVNQHEVWIVSAYTEYTNFQ